MGARLSSVRMIASRFRAGVEVSKEEVSPYVKYHQDLASGDSVSCWFSFSFRPLLPKIEILNKKFIKYYLFHDIKYYTCLLAPISVSIQTGLQLVGYVTHLLLIIANSCESHSNYNNIILSSCLFILKRSPMVYYSIYLLYANLLC